MDLRYFVAGGTCAAFSHGITTPIDVVKTRIQADPKKYSKGIIAATKSIIETEGASALLSGLGPTVVGYGVEGAMKFGVYEVSKPILKGMLSTASKNRDALAFILASVFAGAIAALLLCPMESLRIKQVTDKSFADDSILTGIPKLVAQDGVLSLFGGVLAMLSKQVRLQNRFWLMASRSGIILTILQCASATPRFHTHLENKYRLISSRLSSISFLGNLWKSLISG